MSEHRFDRNVRLFGVAGQDRLRACKVAIVGVGGLGTHVAQQLALLGVSGIGLIDPEELERTNFNRYVCVRHDDPVPGTRKVDAAERLVHSIDPTICVMKVFDSLVSEHAFSLVREADYVFGCLDSEGMRLVLTELCAAYARPYFDLASDIPPGERLRYGGRVCTAWNGDGCLVCLGVLDIGEAQRDMATQGACRDLEGIYGVRRELLDEAGPSVVSINGVVASLAVTEFAVAVAGIRPPQRIQNYLGHLGKVTASQDQPQPDCYYCKGIWGRRESAGVERYLGV
jgi:hypothetical protein